MKNPELYQKTVDILVQAYIKDTLHHGFCSACAVGNIIIGNMGYTEMDQLTGWPRVFITLTGKFSIKSQQKIPENYFGLAKVQIDATGYKWQDLAKVEYAFETAHNGDSRDEKMFNGLMAVIDVLDQIHENTDTALTTSTKNRFQKTETPCI